MTLTKGQTLKMTFQGKSMNNSFHASRQWRHDAGKIYAMPSFSHNLLSIFFS